MKKILFILPFYPYPLTSGGHQAIYNGIIAIKDYYDVYITFPSNHKNTYFELLKTPSKLENIKLFPFQPQKQNKLNFNRILKSIRYRIFDKLIKPTADEIFYKRVTIYTHNNDFLEFVNKIIRENQIEIVQVEMMENISFVLSLPTNVKKIFVHHELKFIKSQLYLSTSGNNLYRNNLVEIEKHKEIYLLNKFDSIITLSSIDKNKLIEAGVKVPINTSFSIVQSNTTTNYPNPISTKKLSFIGPEFHTPNKIGLEWFLENCWETLEKQGYILLIIGNWTNKTIKYLTTKYKNIEFLGFVPYLSVAMKDSIMIVPILVGSGIRMKILEAMSNKIPFVSTSIGAEGIPVTNNVNCFIADTPNDFIESIIRLEDISIRKTFINSALEVIQEKYSMNALRKNRLNIYDSIYL